VQLGTYLTAKERKTGKKRNRESEERNEKREERGREENKEKKTKIKGEESKTEQKKERLPYLATKGQLTRPPV
jgi:hypothetical protein